MEKTIVVKKEKCYNKRVTKGYVLLVTVLSVAAVGVAITLAIINFSINSNKTSFALNNESKAISLSNACVEEGLELIREDINFEGSGSLSNSTGSCTYTVINPGGQIRTINSEGISSNVKKKIAVSINKLKPKIQIESWQELP